MSYWFLKTSYEKASKLRMRPLPDQKLPGGKAINPELNVQCDKKIRAEYPLGTIFVTTKFSEAGGFYKADDLYVVAVGPDEKPAEGPNVATPDMMRAYSDYKGGARSEPTPTPIVEAPSAKGTFLDKIKKSAKNAPPDPVLDGFYIHEDQWYFLVRNLKTFRPTMLVGPTGCGKTEGLELLAARMGFKLHQNFHVFDMGSMYDPTSSLLGVHRLSKTGESVFDYAKFAKVVQQPGFILGDELSRAPLASANILLPVLDSRKVLPVEIAGGEDLRSVPVHEEMCMFATANEGNEYTGTNPMDRALKDRFTRVELDYMPKEIETKVLQKREGILKGPSDTIVGIADNIRNLYRTGELSTATSTRHTLEAAGLVHDGFAVITALRLVFLPLFEGSQRDGERMIVHNMLAGK